MSCGAEVKSVVKQGTDRLGLVKILATNAGIAHRQDIDVITEQDWNNLMVTFPKFYNAMPWRPRSAAPRSMPLSILILWPPGKSYL